MAAREVGTLGSIVLHTADNLQDYGNNWYKPSESWKDFPLKVQVLRKKFEFWQAEFKNFGLLSDKALLETLGAAKFFLEKEQAKLQKRARICCSGHRCWPKFCCLTAVFPASLGRSIQSVIDAFDDLPGFLRAEEDSWRKPYSSLIHKDDHYVPLKVSESAIYSALDNPDGPALVLLHGGPGKGKSTLARHMALHYTEARDKADDFENVIYLECGTQADTSAKQFELFQLVGSDTVTVPRQEQGQLRADVTIPRILTDLLRDQKLLIVLDDVWEVEFLQRMMELFGGGVKCLVTSQLRNLCAGVNCKSVDIQIEDIQQEDARNILASHLELPTRHIPYHLEGFADKIVQESKANPLVLASIARTTDEHPDEVWEWEEASKDYFRLLQSEDTAHVQSEKYPRGFWSAMQISSESLKDEDKKLLILMHMCEGPSVPEAVIHFLYRSTKFQGGSISFAELRKDLEKRNLVNITLVSHGFGKQRSWSIHSLQRRFIEEEWTDGRESAFSSLGGVWDTEAKVSPEVRREFSEGEEAIMITLGALYFDKELAKRVASRMGVPFDRFSNPRRSAVEPITQLLGQPISERWSESLRSSATQVFLKYICNGVLADDGISHLLASPISALAMLSALKDVAIIEEKPLLDESTQGLIKAIVGLMGDIDGVNSSVREAAGRALFYLCDNNLHSAFIVSKSPGVLEAAVRVLSKDPHPKMQVLAAWILANLSRSREVGAEETIVQYPEALSALVRSLSKEDKPRLQLGAAWALSNLASGDGETKLKIVDFPGALENLVKPLSTTDNKPQLQQRVAIALANLAGGDGDKKLKIVNYPQALEKLVLSLPKDNNPHLQRHAARALANLASGDGEIKLKILNTPGALEELVQSLTKDNIPYLQKHAARALANLAAGDGEKKSRIENFPGAVEELVLSVRKNANPDLQEHAARVLANLAAGDGEKKLKIVDSPGALEALVESLSKDDNPDLQENAAFALANLAGGDCEKKMKIANCPGAIEQLVTSLSKDNNPELQGQVARALASLAAGDGDTKLKVSNFPGALEKLAKTSAQDKLPYLEKYSARALVNLAAADAETKRKSSLSFRRKKSMHVR